MYFGEDMGICIVGCYGLDLYCANREEDFEKEMNIHEFNEFPHTYTAQSGKDCFAAARRDGWIVNIKKGIALCPKCKEKIREVRLIKKIKER